MLKDYDEETHPYLTMWATNASFLNDSSEFSFGKEICKEAFQSYEQQMGIEESKCIGYAFSNYDKFAVKKKINSTPCIISLSKTINNASMWAMYSADGSGIAIILDPIELKEIQYTFLKPCFYCDNADSLLNEKNYLEEIEDVYNHFISLKIDGLPESDSELRKFCIASCIITELAPCIKHSAYQYENEFRLIVQGIDKPKFRVRKDIIIPYKEVLVPIKAVKGFVIGPTANYDYMFSSLETFLASKGLSSLDECIVKSEVPYRG